MHEAFWERMLAAQRYERANSVALSRWQPGRTDNVYNLAIPGIRFAKRNCADRAVVAMRTEHEKAKDDDGQQLAELHAGFVRH
jgi:hypothetical protein